MAGGLLTDLYELNMAASYLRRGMTGLATFSLFVRQLPADRGFLVAAGLGAQELRPGGVCSSRRGVDPCFLQDFPHGRCRYFRSQAG